METHRSTIARRYADPAAELGRPQPDAGTAERADRRLRFHQQMQPARILRHRHLGDVQCFPRLRIALGLRLEIRAGAEHRTRMGQHDDLHFRRRIGALDGVHDFAIHRDVPGVAPLGLVIRDDGYAISLLNMQRAVFQLEFHRSRGRHDRRAYCIRRGKPRCGNHKRIWGDARSRIRSRIPYPVSPSGTVEALKRALLCHVTHVPLLLAGQTSATTVKSGHHISLSVCYC
jgi:hypothetical protein